MADGRVRRGTRNRDAILDATAACFDAGSRCPAAPEIAARAGVSERSLHNHFADLDELRAAAAARRWREYAPLVGEVTSVDELLTRRALFFESTAGAWRAALTTAHRSPLMAEELARLDRALRNQVGALFFWIGNDVLVALDVATGWETWDRLRRVQSCTVARARRVVELTVTALTETR